MGELRKGISSVLFDLCKTWGEKISGKTILSDTAWRILGLDSSFDCLNRDTRSARFGLKIKNSCDMYCAIGIVEIWEMGNRCMVTFAQINLNVRHSLCQ